MKVNVGLIGLGRLGRVYARDLAARVTGVRLAALADTNATLAEETARELDVPALVRRSPSRCSTIRESTRPSS